MAEADQKEKKEKPEGSRNKNMERKLENPVLVAVGQPPIKPHETGVYSWQLRTEYGKNLLRKDSPELQINFTGKNSALLQDMYNYSIVPNEKIKKRMDFFYTPYNQQFLLRKHMVFDDQIQADLEAASREA